MYFDKRKTLAVGIAMAGSGTGALIAAPLTTTLLEEYGLHGTFLILGGIFLNILVCGMLMRPIEFYEPKLKKRPKQGTISKDPVSILHMNSGTSNPAFGVDEDKIFCEKLPTTVTEDSTMPGVPASPRVDSIKRVTFSEQTVTIPSPSKPPAPSHDWSILRQGQTWILNICFMLAFLGYFNMATIFIPAHSDAIGLDENDYSLLVALMGGVDICGRVFTSWLMDLHLIPSGAFFTLSVGVSGCLVMVFPSVGADMGALAALCVLFALIVAALPPLQPAVLQDRMGVERLSSTMSTLHFFIGLPFLFSQPMAGKIRTRKKSHAIKIKY